MIHKRTGMKLLPDVFELLGKLGKPSICAAGGHVLAGAVGLALGCDLIIAKEGIGIGTPEVNVGAFPFMVTAMLERELGRKRMAQLMLLGARIDAAEAERIGLVNKVVPAPEFDAAVDEWATALAAKSPLLMKLGKDAMYRSKTWASSTASPTCSPNSPWHFQAFFDKREPRWQGR